VEGERVDLRAIRPEQHFTEPPPRYSEASLVKTLEEFGIGRPSTYVSIIATLLQREYVVLDNRRFRPTDVGRIVNRFLTQHFTPYVDYEFTARLEDDLDAISRGEQEWIPLLGSFWKPFKRLLEDKEETSPARRWCRIGIWVSSRSPAARSVSVWDATVRSSRSAPRTTRKNPVSPVYAPTSGWIRSPGGSAGTVQTAAPARRHAGR